MALSKEFALELENAIDVARRHTAGLLRQPGVELVGAGSKRTAGKLTGVASIVITVTDKLGKNELKERGWSVLPTEIEGVPVDIVEPGASVVANEVEAATEAALAVKERLEGEWLGRPNITGIGVGSKIVAGRFTDEIAIHFYVESKLEAEELGKRGLDPIPTHIDETPTDVIEMKPLRVTEGESGHRDDRFEPLVGGISTGLDDKAYSYGTLGALAFDAANNMVALSNEHVWDGSIGQNVVQPGMLGLNGFDVEFQLDVCNPLNFVRLDTPNTVGGSILAGAAAAAAIAAALSDDVDPTREGQAATPPQAGDMTLEEYTDVAIRYREFPIPGIPFTLDTEYTYERRTDSGVLQHSNAEERRNRHYLLFNKLITDRSVYRPDDLIRLFGLVIQDPENEQKEPVPCDRFFCVAHLSPVGKDEDYPVVLRPWQGIGQDKYPKVAAAAYTNTAWVESRKTDDDAVSHGQTSLGDQLTDKELELIDKYREYLCVYYGVIPADKLPLGPWRKWMFVQTANDVPPGTDPLEAAKTIGGLPVSKNIGTTLDVACGPFVFEDDGSFDIEPFSI
ncbi:MAG: hypothetical protein GY788_20160 [bacterium]|nr:hypothetical protein [bacterium]